MAIFSDNAKSSVLKDVPAENQEQSGSFGEKGGSLPPDQAKSADSSDEDDHVIRKCDPLIGGKL
jgi:hypothetical protein